MADGVCACSMRASLALVGDVPEFRAGRTKLRALEDRLQVTQALQLLSGNSEGVLHL